MWQEKAEAAREALRAAVGAARVAARTVAAMKALLEAAMQGPALQEAGLWEETGTAAQQAEAAAE